jgi:hypothetical protein
VGCRPGSNGWGRVGAVSSRFIDDYVFNDWAPRNPDTAQSIRARVVADFRGTDTDDGKFQTGLVRVLGALRKKTPGAMGT